MASSPHWLDRYRDGRHDQVWYELRHLDDSVRTSDLAEEAQAVCDEMARRARHNVELIVQRLAGQGYRFHSNDDDRTPVAPHHPPTAKAPELAAWLQERFGAAPMTLLSWVRLVGDVWLVGTHPGWPDAAAADPLVIEVEGSQFPDDSVQEYFEDEFDAWSEDHEDDDTDPFVLPLAPDRLHKQNISGGAPYGIVLPDGGVDGLFVGETPMSFVSYLNQVFANGGFPYPTGSPEEDRVKESLARDLLPL